MFMHPRPPKTHRRHRRGKTISENTQKTHRYSKGKTMVSNVYAPQTSENTQKTQKGKDNLRKHTENTEIQ